MRVNADFRGASLTIIALHTLEVKGQDALRHTHFSVILLDLATQRRGVFDFSTYQTRLCDRINFFSTASLPGYIMNFIAVLYKLVLF